MWSEKRLTRYEKARIIGARALQLAYGAPSTIKAPEGLIDPIEIAKIEFLEGKIPLEIIREYGTERLVIDPNTCENRDLSLD